MSRAIYSFALLIIVGVLCSTTIAQKLCPENQEWTTCGSRCPPSCNSSPDQFCTTDCIIGCQCKTKFVLNSSGNCVPPSECKN